MPQGLDLPSRRRDARRDARHAERTIPAHGDDGSLKHRSTLGRSETRITWFYTAPEPSSAPDTRDA